MQFDGLFLRARPHRGAGGSLVVELRGQVHLLRQSGRFELESPMIDALDLASFDQLGFDEHLVVTGAEPQTLTLKEFAGGNHSALALEIGVRAIPRGPPAVGRGCRVQGCSSTERIASSSSSGAKPKGPRPPW